MNLIKPNNYGNFSKLEDECYETKTCSIINTSKSPEYFLFIYNKFHIESPDYKSRIYELSNFFNITVNDTDFIPDSQQSDVFQSTIITGQTEISEPTENNHFEKSTEIYNLPMTTQLTELYTTQLTESITTLITDSSTTQLAESYTSLLTESFISQLTESFGQNEDSIESTTINDATEQIIKIDDSCKDNKKIKNAQGECICDNLNGYYSIKYNNILYSEQCYNIEIKPKNFF